MNAKQVIPFVTVAMTIEEANELNEKLQLESSELEIENFKELIEMIADNKEKDFTGNYKNRRHEWKPYLEIDLSIKEIITEITDKFNEFNQSSQITPHEYSDDCFSSDTEIRENKWAELRDSGCILIIDPISLFCERIRQSLVKAEILSREHTSIVLILPKNPDILKIHELTKIINGDTLSHVYTRFENHFEETCEIGFSNKQSLTRWCFSILPKISILIFLTRWVFTISTIFSYCTSLFLVVGVFSVFFGTIFALRQKRFKRLIIYSSIAQVGFLVFPLFISSIESIVNLQYFLVLYLIQR
jgi:hypothetical protein